MLRRNNLIDLFKEKPSPERIISLHPAHTQTLFDLGLEDKIVGISSNCTYPYHFKATKTIVEQNQEFDLKRIRALSADVIFVDKSQLNEKLLQDLQLVCLVVVTNIIDFDGVKDWIKELSDVFNIRTKGKYWIEKLEFSYTDFLKFASNLPEQKVAFLVDKNPYKAIVDQTFTQWILTLNRFENIYADLGQGITEVEIRKIRIQGDPQLVFLCSYIYNFKEEDAFEIGRATHHAKTVYVNGLFFNCFGTGLFKAFDYFKILQNRIKEEE